MLLALYGLSVVSLLGWFAYFASNTGVVLEQFSAEQALWLQAALSGGVALSSDCWRCTTAASLTVPVRKFYSAPA